MNNKPLNALPAAESMRVVHSALLTHEGGLHARPSIKVIQLAKQFESQVWLAASKEGPWVNAKSIALVIAMKTPAQTRLYFAAEGGDANEAVDALVALVDSDFGNGAAHEI
jgi:phosphocarrier protein HPr